MTIHVHLMHQHNKLQVEQILESFTWEDTENLHAEVEPQEAEEILTLLHELYGVTVRVEN